VPLTACRCSHAICACECLRLASALECFPRLSVTPVTFPSRDGAGPKDGLDCNDWKPNDLGSFMIGVLTVVGNCGFGTRHMNDDPGRCSAVENKSHVPSSALLCSLLSGILVGAACGTHQMEDDPGRCSAVENRSRVPSSAPLCSLLPGIITAVATAAGPAAATVRRRSTRSAQNEALTMRTALRSGRTALRRGRTALRRGRTALRSREDGPSEGEDGPSEGGGRPFGGGGRPFE
jgi:hypothetical protein